MTVKKPNRPTRILVVDDSVVARRVISEILNKEDDLEVVGAAANGRIALAKIPRLQPDLITLDIDMPEMDGLTTLSEIRSRHPEVRVVMCSNLTQRGASATVESLFRGASDYVTKASRTETPEAAGQYLHEQIVPKIRALVGTEEPRGASQVPRELIKGENGKTPIEVVTIGVSTGGPNALGTVLARLPADFSVPILIVQHMPKDFTRYLATRLDTKCSIAVSEACNGEPLRAGKALLAPGNHHMEIRRKGKRHIVITRDGPLVNSCRPSVDVLFESASTVFGSAVLGVILTGMGQDGLLGSRKIYAAGGRILAQDRASSVVWGMPGQVVNAGITDRALPPADLGDEIVRRVMDTTP